jgi:hypothetical protein
LAGALLLIAGLALRDALFALRTTDVLHHRRVAKQALEKVKIPFTPRLDAYGATL